MISASRARSITDADITEELDLIEEKIRNAAMIGRYETFHILPFGMKPIRKEKLLDTLRSNMYSVAERDEYDPQSGWTATRLEISWEKEEG